MLLLGWQKKCAAVQSLPDGIVVVVIIRKVVGVCYGCCGLRAGQVEVARTVD